MLFWCLMFLCPSRLCMFSVTQFFQPVDRVQGSDSETRVYPNTDLCLLLMFHTGYSNLAGVNKDGECTTCEIQTFIMTMTWNTAIKCGQGLEQKGNLHTWWVGLEQGVADVDLQ